MSGKIRSAQGERDSPIGKPLNSKSGK